MDQVKRLSVAEAFYSIQGEGKTMGVPSVFIRLAGCNLMCGGRGTEKDGQLYNGATWRCDSIEVWRKGTMYTPIQLVEKLNKEFSFINKLRKGAHLILTGGEPMMQQAGIKDFLDHLLTQYRIIPYTEIETNGTIFIKPEFYASRINLQFNVSPKLANSGESFVERRLDPCYTAITNVQFKYVVKDREDVEEVVRIIKDYNIPINKLWLMPAASTVEELSQVAPIIVEAAKDLGCNYSHRIHISIWNKKTGV